MNFPERPDIRTVSTVEAIVPEESKRYLNHFVDEVVRPDGTPGYHHRLEFKAGVMVAYLERVNGRLWVPMVDQFRYPINRWSRELPSGGKTEEDASLEDAAARELLEETGIKVASSGLRPLFPGPLFGTVGVANQSFYVFEGRDGVAGKENLDAEEVNMISSTMHRLEDIEYMVGREIVETVTAASVTRLLYQEAE